MVICVRRSPTIRILTPPSTAQLKTLWPRQNDHHYANDILLSCVQNAFWNKFLLSVMKVNELPLVHCQNNTRTVIGSPGHQKPGYWPSDARIPHYSDVIMSAMASQITGDFHCLINRFFSGADQRKYQSSASLAFKRGIHRWPVNSPHKEPVTRKLFPFDDVIMPVVNCNVKMSKGKGK